MKGIIIPRLATLDDMPKLIELYISGLEELGEDYKESLLVKKILDNYYLAPCYVVENNGIVVGMAGFTTVISSHSGVAMLCDYIFYVEPEYRNIKTLSALVSQIKAFAKAQNMPLKIELSIRNDEKLRSRLLSIFGFKVYSLCGAYDGK